MAYSVAQMAAIAKNAGFSDKTALIMGGIAMAESSGNPMAHNTNAATGDNSYGLWQINMLGDMGPSRRKSFGISSNSELFNPAVNAKAAYKIYQSQGLNAWSTYKNGAYKQHLSGVSQADYELLDPLDIFPGDQGTIPSDIVPGVSELEAISEATVKTAQWISTPSNWVRVLYVIGGGVVIIAGVAYLAKDTAIQGVAGSAIKAVKGGAKTIKKVKKVT